MSARPAAADSSRESRCHPRACCRGEHLCQLFVRPTFRLAYSHGVRPDWFLRAAQFLMFPFVLGEFISRPTFDCPCERYLTMIPCMLYAEDFFCWATAWIDCSQAPSYCVNWLFTSCSTSSTSHRGFPCVLPNIYGSSRRSLGHLLDVDNPSTFTTTTRLAAIADIVANRRRSSRIVRITPVNFLRRLFLSALDSDWLIYNFELKLNDFSFIYLHLNSLP